MNKKRLLGWLVAAALVIAPAAHIIRAIAADLSDNATYSETDASNNTTTNPGWPENMAPSRVNDAARALQGALKRFWDRIGGTIASTGSGNAYTITYSVSPTTYGNGETFTFKPNFTNYGAASLNINAVGWKSIVKPSTNGLIAVAASDIGSGNHLSVQFNQTADQFVIVSAFPNYQGRQTVFVPAGAMLSRATIGATASVRSATTVNLLDLSTLDFDQNYEQYAQFSVGMPKSWDLGSLAAQFFWTTDSTTGNVVWNVQCLSAGNGDLLTVAWGSTVTVTSAAAGAATSQQVSGEATGMSCSGTPAAGDMLFFQVLRDAKNASDTAIRAARLLGLKIYYNIVAPSDL